MAKLKTKKKNPSQGAPGGTGLFGGVSIPSATASKVLGTNSLDSDPLYQTAQAQQQRAQSGADATALYQTNQINANYGYSPDGSIDLNNPYSQAALMRDTFLQSRQGNTTSYAAQGQLYSGALQNAQDESTRQYNIGGDQLAKNRQSALDQVTATKAGTYSTAQTNSENALADALLRRLQGGTS